MKKSREVGLFLDTPFGRLHVPIETQLDYPAEFFVWIKGRWPLYREFIEHARNAKAWGAEQYGAKAIFEVMRWDRLKKQRRTTAKPKDPFALNNNFTSGMARLAMLQFQDLRGFFRCRGSDGLDDNSINKAA